MTTIVALLPAYQEEASIAATIEALLAQDRRPDLIVAIPNGCTDRTAEVARQYPIEVLELPKLEHKKSEALNTAWHRFARDADIVICLDADTILPPNAVGDWEKELAADPKLGGSSSKFTMLPQSKKAAVLGGEHEPESHWAGYLTRLQASEFAAWTDCALRRGYTTVLAGTGCAISGQALRDVAELNGQDMKEEAWKHLASTPRGALGARGSTPGSTGMAGPSGLTDSHGWTPTERKSREEWSLCTNATTAPASTPITSNSAPRETTSGTWSEKDGTTSHQGLSAHAVADPTRIDLAAGGMNAGANPALIDTSRNMPKRTERRGGQRSGRDTGGTETRYLPSKRSATCEIESRFSLGSASSGSANGPWSYKSLTEDFLLTYRIRQLGGRCHVSPTVRAYTDSMKATKALMAQRSKWSVGTVEDLLRIGVNRYTLIDWWQQFAGLSMAAIRLLWVALIVALVATGMFTFHVLWWVAVPLIFSLGQGLLSLRIPHRDKWDVALAFSIFPAEHFAWMRSYWFVAGWAKALKSHFTGIQPDLWAAQTAAESK